MATTATIKSSAVAMSVEGLAPALRAFNEYGKEANAELRAASRKIAGETVTAAKSRAGSVPQQAPLVASTLRVRSDRVPAILAGGAKRVGHRKHPAGAFLFGAEFGGRRTRKTMQFLPHKGRTGYFIFPTLRARGRKDTRIYLDALDKLGAKWAGIK